MMYPTEEEDEFPDTMGQNLYVRNNASRPQQHPMTAAVDGAANRFSQQQGFTMNPMSYPFTPAAAQNQLQALQLQMMQMEIARLQVGRFICMTCYHSYHETDDTSIRICRPSSIKLSSSPRPRPRRSVSDSRRSL